MTQSRLIMLVILVALVGGVLLSVQSANQQVEEWQKNREASLKGEPADEGDIKSDVVGETVTFTITQGEQKRWLLRVNKVVYDRNREWANLSTVTGEFYNEAGEVVGHFKSDSGDLNQAQKEIILKDNVQVESVPKSKDDPVSVLQAPRLIWKSKAEWIVTEGGVKLTTAGMGESTAQRCLFSLDMDIIQLEGNADSVFMDDEDNA